MKIVVLVKEVPDTYGERKLDLETGIADRSASDPVPDEIGERALEFALSHAEANSGTEVTVLSMAPQSATATVRKALAMGAVSSMHVADPALAGADLVLTAQVLAAALRRSGFDLVITGNSSTDGSGGAIPAMLAELLDVPHVTGLVEAAIGPTEVSGSRAVDGGVQQVVADLPAVLSVTEALPDARFPNFKGIMAAKKKPVELLSAADLGIEPEDYRIGRSIMLSVAKKPPRAAGTKITDEGDAGVKIAEYLVANRLA